MYNCILMIIIPYLKTYNCVQILNYDDIWIFAWNHLIIGFRYKYLKPYNTLQKLSRNNCQLCVTINTQWT